LDEIDLTYTQYITMMVLWERRSVTAKELGGCLFLDSGTLTPLLKKLESKGWVTRKRAKEDERVLIVTLTKEGEMLRDKAVSIPEKMSCCVKLSPEEGKTLYTLLYKMLGND
jgi:DNA-binding MarR family transcriptional regulator